MASPETVELRAMADEALAEELQESHQARFNLRFQGATRQLADVSTVGKARKRVARIATLLREREILAEVDASSGAPATAEQPADEPEAADADGDEAKTADDEPEGDEPGDDADGDEAKTADDESEGDEPGDDEDEE